MFLTYRFWMWLDIGFACLSLIQREWFWAIGFTLFGLYNWFFATHSPQPKE